MILYFSSTGNTEYVAKSLADMLEDDIIDLSTYSKEGKVLDVESEKPYIVLTPIYISTIPTFIMKLLNKSSFKGNNKMYFIMTCAGKNGVSAASVYAKKLCKKKKLEYMGIHHFSMPQDYLMFFTIQSKEDNDKRFAKAISDIPAVANKIKNNECLSMEKVGLAHKLSIKPVIWIFDKLCIKPKKFYTTDDCISCGLCAKVCPLANIKLNENKRPVWGKNCVHCSACINHCPKRAIEYGKKTQGKDRYVAIKYNSNKLDN